MNIDEWKGITRTFLCVETNRDFLHDTDIVNNALLLKIGKGNTAMIFIHFDRRDGGRNFSYQHRSLYPIDLVAVVNELLGQGATKPAAVPGSHLKSFWKQPAEKIGWRREDALPMQCAEHIRLLRKLYPKGVQKLAFYAEVFCETCIFCRTSVPRIPEYGVIDDDWLCANLTRPPR